MVKLPLAVPTLLVGANQSVMFALFMVISGFIFTVIAGDREIRYGGFLRNRLLRIYPLFVFAVFLQLMVSTYNDQRNYGFLQLLSWLMPFRSETVPLSPYFVQLWSIWVEFQFYLVFPALLALMTRIRGMLHLGATTVTGKTLGENVADARVFEIGRAHV